ncbi:MAG: VIT1/CCC1 transporter family protein [Alphaproteobacteria bacterium]|nr:VIT1/CCC1 transporter family protein [Alphaproteobacteria bacterium]
MPTLSQEQLNLLQNFQKDELTSAILYKKIAKRVKDKNNKSILLRISTEEQAHAHIWQQYTKKELKPNFFKVLFYQFVSFLLGYTFVIKILETHEYKGIQSLQGIKESFPEVEHIISQEETHEAELINMLNEERLNYIGAMVLGLNDALVELTGCIAGLTFVLMNTKLIALAGIITGVAATLSMAASNYLAEKANGNKKALVASCYTGIAYLITVIFLTLPYLLFAKHLFIPALLVMLCIVIFLIFIFSAYISIVKSEKIAPRFYEMAGISLTVALISFLIGIIAKSFFGIEM